MWLKKCNQSGIHWNKSKTNRLVENLLFASSKFDCWHKVQVSMTNNIYRQTSNSEEQLLSKKRQKRLSKLLEVWEVTILKMFFLETFHVSLLWNRFESLNELIKDTFDVFLMSESKLDCTFSDSQFSIPSYCTVWKNRNKNGGGILFYIKEEVIEHKQLFGDLEILTLKIILDEMKILLMGLYKSPSFNEKHFLFHLNNLYNFFCTKYENITLIGDFTMIPETKN